MKGQRSNLNLLRKKSFFKKDKVFLNKSRKDFSPENKEIDITKKRIFNSIFYNTISKIQEKRRRETNKTKIYFSIIVLAIFITSFFIYTNIKKNNYEQKIKDQKLNELIHIKKINNYTAYIEEGDSWIEKKNWHNAIFKYKQAIEVFPNKYKANYRLALAYSYNCSFKNEDCEIGNKLNNKLLTFFPENEDLLKLKQIFGDKL